MEMKRKKEREKVMKIEEEKKEWIGGKEARRREKERSKGNEEIDNFFDKTRIN